MASLVTGGGGFIGSHLAEALAARGEHVRVLDNFITGRKENLAGLPVEIIDGDVRDQGCVRAALRGVQTVFHLAALGSVARSVEDPLATHAVNETGTLTLLECSRHAGVQRVVFASSSSVYGMGANLPKREEGIPAPASPYAVSKLMGEYYSQVYWNLYHLETVCLRYFNVFGPRQDPDSAYAAVIPRFIGAALDGRAATIHGDGTQSRDFTYVGNTVAATIAAATAPQAAGKILNVATGERHSLLDLIAVLERMLGRQIMRSHEQSRPGDVQHSQACIDRARQFIGYEPGIPFADGLDRTIQWFLRARPMRAPGRAA